MPVFAWHQCSTLVPPRPQNKKDILTLVQLVAVSVGVLTFGGGSYFSFLPMTPPKWFLPLAHSVETPRWFAFWARFFLLGWGFPAPLSRARSTRKRGSSEQQQAHQICTKTQ